MSDPDFYKFVGNIKYYLNQDLRFENLGKNYPQAYCGDIVINFNHYKTNKEAEAKWNERKRRINFDNLFIITSDRSETITDEDIISLSKVVNSRGLVVFSNRKISGINYLVPLPKDKNANYVYNYMEFFYCKLLGIFEWEKVIDWVFWLNTGQIKHLKYDV